MKCYCIIHDLIEKSFSSRDESVKIILGKMPRPTPMIDLKQTTTVKTTLQTTTRKFHERFFERFSWIATCQNLNKIFCWPCLLFVDNKTSWTTYGFNDIGHLNELAKKHQKSKIHINAVIKLGMFGENNKTRMLLEEQKQILLIKHNETVAKNRNILKRFIDATIFLANENSLCHDTNSFVELLKLMSNYDEVLSNYFKNTSGICNTIQNDLIKSISEILIEEIKTEVTQTPFVAILLDETCEISHQLSIVLRYVNVSGKIVERFLFFEDESVDSSAIRFKKIVINTITSWNCSSKVIAQTFDGQVLEASELNETTEKIKELFCHARFIHSYAHNLNLVLYQSVTYIKECKIFFSFILKLSTFLFNSTKTNQPLNELIKRTCPELITTKWYLSSQIVNNVKNHKESLHQIFREIMEKAENWDFETINMAKGFLNLLNDFMSIFLLNTFASISILTDNLFNFLQGNTLNILLSNEKIMETKGLLYEMKRHNFEQLCADTLNITDKPDIHDIKLAGLPCGLKFIYNEIFDTIINQIHIRFEELNDFIFFELLNSNFFFKFNSKFPENLLELLKTNYKDFFDISKLHNELEVIYKTELFFNKSVPEIIQTIKEYSLCDVLGDVYRLACLICTIPYSKVFEDNSLFFALSRIKLYISLYPKHPGQNRLPELTLMHIEKDLLSHLQSKPNFYDLVRDNFQKIGNHNMELEFKSKIDPFKI